MDPVLKAHPWLPSHTLWFQGQIDDLIEAFEADDGLRIGERTMALVRQVMERSDAIDQALDERPWTLVHGDLRCLTSVLQLYRLSQEPESTVRAAVLNGEAIQRFAGVIEELRAWEALPGAVLP